MNPDSPDKVLDMTNPAHVALAQSVGRTIVRAALITGHDEHENPFCFRKYPEGWFDVYRECLVAQSYIDSFVFPNVQRVRFTDDFEMSRAEWLADGTPLELSLAVIAVKKLARETEMMSVELHYDRVLKVG